MRYLLMIPGPVEIPEEILCAFQGQTIAHYGKDFRDIYIKTTDKLSKVLGSSGMSFLLPGTGSMGLETVSSTFCRSKKCLVLNNGFFGERINLILSTYSNNVDQLIFKYGEPIDLNTLKIQLKKRKYDLVFMTHVETSTGVLNPIKEISNLIKEQESLFFLDCISSAGIELIKMDEWNIDAVVTASQKGFECPPGLGMITINKKLISELNKSNKASWYTDLRTWVEYYKKWYDWHPYPSTLPTNVVMALLKSLETIAKEGISKRIKLYEETSKRLRKAITKIGLELFAKDGSYAHGLTSVSSINIFNSSELVLFLKNKLGIQIAGSLGSLRESVFRIGHMSRNQCKQINLIGVISGIMLFMKKKGIKFSSEEVISEIIR